MKDIARIELYANGELAWLNQEVQEPFSLKKKPKKKHVDPEEYLFTKAYFHNWYPGFMKSALQEVNRCLLEEDRRALNASKEYDKAQLVKLKKQTLYIPDFVLIDYNTRNGSEEELYEVNELFADYDYKYEILPVKELSNKILESEEPFYYFVFIRGAGWGFFNIINSQTGKIVYARFKPMDLEGGCQGFSVYEQDHFEGGGK